MCSTPIHRKRSDRASSSISGLRSGKGSPAESDTSAVMVQFSLFLLVTKHHTAIMDRCMVASTGSLDVNSFAECMGRCCPELGCVVRRTQMADPVEI